MRKSRKWKTLSLAFCQLVVLTHFHPSTICIRTRKKHKTFDIIYFILLLLLLFLLDEVHDTFISHGLNLVSLLQLKYWFHIQFGSMIAHVFVERKVRSSKWLKVSHEKKLNCLSHYTYRTLVSGIIVWFLCFIIMTCFMKLFPIRWLDFN